MTSALNLESIPYIDSSFDPEAAFDRWLEEQAALPQPEMKIIAHMFGDSFIQNSELEGLPLRSAIQFLLDSLQAKVQGSFVYTFSNREEAIDKLNQLLMWEEQIEAARTSENLEASLTDIAHNIIAKLDAESSVLLPGGWIGLKGGHAMLYACGKAKAKKPSTFTVMNRGEGLQYHVPKLFETKTKFQFTRKIKNVNDHILSSPEFFVRLLGYRAFIPDTTSKAFTANELYTFTENILGKASEEQEPDEAYITAIQSGTCSWKVLMSLLRTLVPLAEYRQFKCELYLHNLSRWLEICKRSPHNESSTTLLHSSANAFKKFIEKTKALDWLALQKQWHLSVLLTRIEKIPERYHFQSVSHKPHVVAPKPCVLQPVAEAIQKQRMSPPPFPQKDVLQTAVGLCSCLKGYTEYATKLYQEQRHVPLQDFCKMAFDTFPLLGESLWMQIQKDQIDELINDLYDFSCLYAHAVAEDENGVANRLYLFRTLEVLVQRALFLETGDEVLPPNLLSLPADFAKSCSCSDPLASYRLQKLCEEHPDSPKTQRAVGYFPLSDKGLVIDFFLSSNAKSGPATFLDSYLARKGVLAETRKNDPDYIIKAFTQYTYLPKCVQLLQHQFFCNGMWSKAARKQSELSSQ